MSAPRQNFVKNQSYTISENLTVTAHVTNGQRGMVHNRFDRLYDAVLFVHWIKKHTQLDGIANARIKFIDDPNNPLFIVRVTPKQQAILEQSSSVKLDTNNKFDPSPLAETFVETMELFLPSQSLSEKAKWDAYKIMNCLSYIANNLNHIAAVVDDRHNPKHYHFPNDMAKGVLRDEQLTSFHTDGFKNGEEAKTALLSFLNELDNNILRKLSPTLRIRYAQKLEYDDKVGCLDKRNARANIWASQRLLSNIQTLDDLMEEILIERGINKIALAKIGLVYCEKNKITECFNDGRQVPITKELLEDYATHILGEDEEEEKVDAPINEQYLHLCKTSKDGLGLTGMVQHRFSTNTEAATLVTWLKQQTALKDLNIRAAKVNANEEKKIYMVRVSPQQFDALLGAGSHQKLSLTPNFTSIYQIFLPTLAKQDPEQLAKQHVLEIEKDILQKQVWKKIGVGFFGIFSNQEVESKEPTKTAQAILDLITTTKTNTNTNWTDIQTHIKTILTNATQSNSKNRTTDTTTFYTQELKKLT